MAEDNQEVLNSDHGEANSEDVQQEQESARQHTTETIQSKSLKDRFEGLLKTLEKHGIFHHEEESEPVAQEKVIEPVPAAE